MATFTIDDSKKLPFYYLSDWDGTITTVDSNDQATDNLGMGITRRRELNEKILSGEMNFREAFKMQLDSVAENHTFDETLNYLRDTIVIDPSFPKFFKWCQSKDIPVVVVSSGMVPIIKAVLEKYMDADDVKQINIIANDVEYLADGKWTIRYRHPDSPFGHDKSRSTGPYRELPHRPIVFFSGDGVSDLSAARAADLLFVKVVPGAHNDLARHCKKESIPHIVFDSFDLVQKTVEDVVVNGRALADLVAPSA